LTGEVTGLSRHQGTASPTLLRNFSEHVEAVSYFNLFNSGWPGSFEKLERNILFAMENARSLKVNLDGLVNGIEDLPAVFQKGSRGIEPPEVIRGVERGNVTNWEVWTIYSTESLRNKATFYLNGQPIAMPAP
jgi:hypothetical protein